MHRGDQGPIGAVAAVASVAACAAILAACSVALILCQRYAAAAAAAGGGAAADAFGDYTRLASDSIYHFNNAIDNINDATNSVNGVVQNVNTLQSIVGTIGISAVAGAVAGAGAYFAMNSVKDETTGDVYLLDNSYSIGVNPIGDVSFNGNLYIENNMTISGIITNYYTQSQVNTLLAPTTAVSYNTVNVFKDYITNGKFFNPTIPTNDYWPYFFIMKTN